MRVVIVATPRHLLKASAGYITCQHFHFKPPVVIIIKLILSDFINTITITITVPISASINSESPPPTPPHHRRSSISSSRTPQTPSPTAPSLPSPQPTPTQMHHFLALPLLHLQSRRLRRRLKRLQRKLSRLDEKISEYSSHPSNDEPNVVMGIAMYESRAELEWRINDAREDLNIVRSRIMTVESERVRKRDGRWLAR
ncbi:uncharacterized protein LAJ45_01120 [Morchella importuna]|uniref:uncharacterized protein n=1 Tax=Morchella importuna TaxID=1174673 RepID=UPI001E8E1E5B|nr:uncharacterized protein LAJ45_01120 [Morchella importuna]KAH8154592.1 hypothetical protein LAJ45_01120 [Morchella importuna]